MGRHSRRDRGGSPAPPPPSLTDTGSWEHWWEKTGSQPPVLDRPPPTAATGGVAFPLDGSPADSGRVALQSVPPPPPEPPRGGGRRRAEASRGDLLPPPLPAPNGGGPARTGPGLGRLAPPGSTANRGGPAHTGPGPGRLAPPAPTPYGSGPGLGPLAPPAPTPYGTGPGLGPLAPPAPTPYGTDSGLGPLAPTTPYGTGSGLGPLAPAAPTPYGRGISDPGSTLAPLARPDERGAGGPGIAASAPGSARLGQAEAGLGRTGLAEGGGGPRRGPATRADLARPDDDPEPSAARGRRRAQPDTAGATALMPKLDPAPDPDPGTSPDPDEVTDTGARRARSAFRLAEQPPDEHEDDYDEPGLILQWGIFVAQTLTGGAVGLGVWLGFYRLWSTWPFYAAPAVGAAMILMLVVARTLRRRYGHELDLLTAVITIGVGTVLAVLPAAFTLQGLG